MSRVDHERCRDILDAVAAVERYVTKLGGVDGDMAYGAVVRKLEVIGEAANRITADTKTLAPEIEWHKISGFRNIAVHEYWRLNPAVVEAIAVNYLPPLRAAIERISNPT